MSDAAFFRTTLVMVTLLSLRSASGAKRKDTFEKMRSMGMTTGVAPAGSVMPDRVPAIGRLPPGEERSMSCRRTRRDSRSEGPLMLPDRSLPMFARAWNE